MKQTRSSNQTALARLGEEVAARHLQSLGYSIEGRNVRFRHGELDIVAKHGHTVVFVEVKTRRSDRFGAPQWAVHPRKQARIRALASAWLVDHRMWGCTCRFDVVAIRTLTANPTDAEHFHIEHFEGGF